MSSVEGFSLSPQQRRLWQLSRGASRLRRARCRLRLRGACDPAALRAALEGVVARHEILRTRFRTIAGLSFPVQEVRPEGEAAFESFDLSGRPAAEHEAELRRWEEAPAELDTALLHGALFRLSDEEHVLSLRVPALCVDPVSLGNLAREIALGYAPGQAREEPPAQYADLAELFNALAESEEAAHALELWRRTDFGLLGRQSLPLPPTPDPAPEFTPGKVSLAVPEASAAGLEALAGDCGVSLPDVLLGLWLVLLGRLGRPPLERGGPVLVGRGFSGRNYEGLGPAVGLLARHVPIQVEIDDREPFSRLLPKVAEAVAEAEARQEYFDWETAVPAAAREKRSFFSHCFEMRTRPEPWNGGGLVFELEESEAYYDLFEVRLEAVREPGGLTLDVTYDARSYDAGAAGRLAEALSALVEAAASSPHSPVGALGLLGAEERRRLLSEWSGSPVPPRPFAAVHEQFEDNARRHPGQVAVESRERSRTYAELDAAAGRLARQLAARGVGPEVLVAVCLERTWEVLVALLGIFKAGGAYLPLDPMNPPARLAAILEDAGAELVLTEPPWNDRLEDGSRTLIVSELLASEEPPAAPASRRTGAGELAYVLYTSGSSGHPKGVMVSHGALANYLGWVGEVLLGGGRSMPLITRPSFDASLKQLFGPLLSGGRVSLLPPEVLDNPVGLLESVSESRDEVLLNCVPSLWRVLVNALESEMAPRPAGRVVAFLGGEALSEELLERCFELFDDLEVWNLYGPTEATANAAAARLRQGAPITLGRPVAGSRVYLLDPWLAPVPEGLAGEIFLGGAGLARGYHRRPVATAERFLPDPWSETPGARLYRSGDLARCRADGDGPEFLGRIDQQVKLRGYRIELEEIEARLLSHPDVAEAAVVVQDTAVGEGRLLTFVVPRAEKAPDSHELAVFLAGELPEYMVPAYFLTWQELPRTAGGKVDRRRLAAVDPAGYDFREPYVEPRGPVEKKLAEIWCRLLDQERIGRKDNFYHRGGHSLAAIRILAEVRRAFGVSVALAVILETGSLEEMAAAVDRARRETGTAAPG